MVHLPIVNLKASKRAKEMTKKTKRQPTEWKKIFANNIFYKGLICKIYRELKKLNNRKQTIN